MEKNIPNLKTHPISIYLEERMRTK